MEYNDKWLIGWGWQRGDFRRLGIYLVIINVGFKL